MMFTECEKGSSWTAVSPTYFQSVPRRRQDCQNSDTLFVWVWDLPNPLRTYCRRDKVQQLKSASNWEVTTLITRNKANSWAQSSFLEQIFHRQFCGPRLKQDYWYSKHGNDKRKEQYFGPVICKGCIRLQPKIVTDCWIGNIKVIQEATGGLTLWYYDNQHLFFS